MTPDLIPDWIWRTETGARDFARDSKDLAGLFVKVGRRVRQDVADLRGDGGYVAQSAKSAQDVVNEIAEVSKMIDTDVDTIRKEVKSYATDIGGVANALRRERRTHQRLESEKLKAPGGIRHEYDESLRRVEKEIGSLVGNAKEHDRNHAKTLRTAVEDLEGMVSRLGALGWKPGNPPHLGDMLDGLEEVTQLEVITDVARKTGLDVDEKRIQKDLDELLEAGLIDPEDLQNPALLAYVTYRSYAMVPITDEWKLAKVSVDEDGSLKAFGMDNWDPAALATIQQLLDQDARIRRKRDHATAYSPPKYELEEGETIEDLLYKYRRDSANALIEDLKRDEGEKFYSSDLFDDLVHGYENGYNTPSDDALLMAISHSGLNGPIPVYDMTLWEKVKEGAGDLALPLSVLSTLAIFSGAGTIPGIIGRGAAGGMVAISGINIVDACAVNADGERCVGTVALESVGQVSKLKVKAIKKHLRQDGVLGEADKRLIKGLETMYDMQDKVILVTDPKMPGEFESSKKTKKYVEENAPQPGEEDEPPEDAEEEDRDPPDFSNRAPAR